MDAEQVARRCPNAIFVGTATLLGYEFELDSIGVATVVEECASSVNGALWLIPASDERSLDRYEGVGAGCYRKAILTVIDSEGSIVPALAYISNREAHDGVTHRSSYMDNIIANAKRLGFDSVYIASLEAKLEEAYARGI